MWPCLALFAVSLTMGPVTAAAQSTEREMFVSVLNKADEPVPNLDAKDFVVREDDRVREVLRVRRATEPIDLAILLDNSQALTSQVSDLRQGLDAFIGKMRGQAHITLIGIGDRPTVLTDYTNDEALLKKGVGLVYSMSGAGAVTLEAIQETLSGLKKRGAERSAIVVIWVGGKEFSTQHADEVLRPLAEQNTALHVVTVSVGLPADAATLEGRNRDIVFDRGTTQSGGRRQNVLTSMALADALNHLAAELLAQYRVTYARPATLIPPEKIEVSMRAAGLVARGTPVPTKGASR